MPPLSPAVTKALIGTAIAYVAYRLVRKFDFKLNLGLPAAIRNYGLQVGAGVSELFKGNPSPNQPSATAQSSEVSSRLEALSRKRLEAEEKPNRIPGEAERVARYPWLRPGEPWRQRHSGEPMPGQPSQW